MEMLHRRLRKNVNGDGLCPHHLSETSASYAFHQSAPGTNWLQGAGTTGPESGGLRQNLISQELNYGVKHVAN